MAGVLTVTNATSMDSYTIPYIKGLRSLQKIG